MSQSNAIFAAIFIAYVIFITLRGELPIYWGLLVGNAGATNAAPGNASLQSTGEQAAQSQMAVDTTIKAAQAAAVLF